MAKRRIISDYPEITIDPETLEGYVDFDAIFGRKGPVHIEIGSGKGTFLVSEAMVQPENNYLGIEWANRFYRLAVDRLGRWGIDNVRIMRTDAAFFFAEHVPDNSVSWFHIYFPDPWPKARHNKRRLICTENVEQIIRCLEPGGVLNLATDHADYFEQMEEVLNIEFDKGTLKQIPFTRAAGAKDGEIVGTNFERKYIVEGRKINTIAAQKP
ncbi:MAG: tRNA (guanosine(46)-N7)-methyltransferase TrmB [Phycisphaerae bacterium]|nr:tRNA (guanosine(46)-N7)-methyltransferase TrmB [Phycisphaerae bacterium]